jgi:uncharacterized protein (DUF488 family)
MPGPPQHMIRPLKLPSRPARVRAESKALWNEARSIDGADFFTIGYEGRPTEDVLTALRSVGIRLLLDIRHTPVSMYRPDLSKRNFCDLLAQEGIEYLHIPEWGVPRQVRVHAAQVGSRDPIWQWYDANVVERFFALNLHRFLNMGNPLAMMCMEADPVECHRHRLFLALEKQGLRGFDL